MKLLPDFQHPVDSRAERYTAVATVELHVEMSRVTGDQARAFFESLTAKFHAPTRSDLPGGGTAVVSLRHASVEVRR